MRITPNPVDIDMMISKFIINLPSFQLRQDRIWIHLQKMFHYFIDQVVDIQPLSDFQQQDKQTKQFFTLVVERLPSFLKLEVPKILKLINDGYSSTPIYGVVILNLDETKILLVESHKPSGLFGVPKGKINQDETPIQCACRETKEQVGINVHLSENHKIQIFYSKSCCFYICKIDQHNINVLFNKNTQTDKNNGKKKLSKEIKSLVWLELTNPLQLKLNVATKKIIDKLRSQKAVLKSTVNNSNRQQGNSNKVTNYTSKGSQSPTRVQKYRQVTSQSTRSIQIEGELSGKCPFDIYQLRNRKMYEKLFQDN